MTEDLDDLEEINLAPDRTGSARQIRSGRKRAQKALTDSRKKPFWKRQLSGGKAAHNKPRAVTLASESAPSPQEREVGDNE